MDWEQIKDAQDILRVRCLKYDLMPKEMTSYQNSHALQHCFSSEQLPMLWHALPAFEALQTTWKAKCNDLCFTIYCDVINKGLTKFQKYYLQFDKKPSYVLALGKLPLNLSPLSLWACLPQHLKYAALHPYYKLKYIKMAWGGAKEQANEIQAGNVNAKNWQDKVLKILETTVSYTYHFLNKACSDF